MSSIDKNLPVHLIVNPRSGYGGRKRLLCEIRSLLHEEGVELQEYTTQGPGDATRYAASIAGKAAAVMVWGGDGTANEVANGLLGSDTPVLPCPAGTENLLAKELKIPHDPEKIIQMLLHGKIAPCDVGCVNHRNFMLIIGVGFDGEVVRRLSANRMGHISHLSYFWPIWRTFWEHDFPLLRIIVDGEEIYHGRGLAFVGNISRYAVGLRICRDAKLEDGLLDLVVFPCKEQTSLILHATWTLLRLHPLKGGVLYRRAKNIRIESDHPVPCQVDGDVGPNTPLDISIAKGRLNLIAPLIPHGLKISWWPWEWKGSDIL